MLRKKTGVPPNNAAIQQPVTQSAVLGDRALWFVLRYRVTHS